MSVICLLLRAVACLQTFSVSDGAELKAYFMKRPLGLTMIGEFQSILLFTTLRKASSQSDAVPTLQPPCLKILGTWGLRKLALLLGYIPQQINGHCFSDGVSNGVPSC